MSQPDRTRSAITSLRAWSSAALDFLLEGGPFGAMLFTPLVVVVWLVGLPFVLWGGYGEHA